MYKPLLDEFLQLTAKHNVIPVYKEITADLDTPVSSFLKLKKDSCSFLLESVEGGENVARYSFLGTKPSIIFESKGNNITVTYQPHSEFFPEGCDCGKQHIRTFITSRDPLEDIKALMLRFKPAHVRGVPRFYGGFVGYCSYDMVRFFENIPDDNPDTLQVPDSIFILTDTILAFDHVNNSIKIISNVILPDEEKVTERRKREIYARAVKKIDEIESQLRQPLKLVPRRAVKNSVRAVASNFTKSKFCSQVRKAQEYIRKGDVIQVVLSQRFSIKTEKDPFEIYRDLRKRNPSPYMFFFKFNSLTLVGSSPEILVRCEDSTVRVRPIAGTRKRGATDEEDKRLEKELLNDSKERAEHLMLVDLGRNDLGRISNPGAVRVNEFMSVERYSHVMHLVSDVTGELNTRRYDSFDVLRACFPAGTVSGSPKIRAMEIIDELENVRRGPYAGAVGYFSFSRTMDTCITIRTVLIKDKTAYIQAGAGIVLDSVPEKEYYETVNKARALVESVINQEDTRVAG